MPDSTLHAALIAARASIPAIPKTATNPHFGNKYASLGDILAAVLPPLHKQGLSLTCFVRESVQPAPPALAVMISLGPDNIVSSVPLIGATDMQKLGGAMTYAMRYAIGGLLALELEDDDDGNRASAPQRAATPSAPRPSASTLGPFTPSGAWDGKSCPECGEKSVSITKSGKNAGLWMCKPWEEKGRKGCWAKWTSESAVRSAWQEKQARGADAFLAPRDMEEPPPPSDDDLPF